jgi:hypothetical protein
MKPVLKPPGTMLLKLIYDEQLSKFAFDVNLRRYSLSSFAFADDTGAARFKVRPARYHCMPRHRQATRFEPSFLALIVIL